MSTPTRKRKPAPPQTETIGADPETRAFIGGTEDLDEQRARRRLMMAAVDLATMQNGLTGSTDQDVIFYLLWESARRYGLTEREVYRLIGEVVAYIGESDTHHPGKLPADLAALAVDKPRRLDTFLAAVWGDDTP